MNRDQPSINSDLESEDNIESDYLSEKYILLKDLKKYTFSPGTIKWKEKLTLARPGDLLNHQYFVKFEKVTDRVYCDFVFRPWNISKLKQLFSEFKLAKSLSTKQRYRIKLLKMFRDIYWTGEKEGALAEIMEAAYEEFYQLDSNLSEELKSSNEDIFRTCSFKAGMAVILAIGIGIVDYKSLQEIYHLPYFFYSGIMKTLSFKHVLALSAEWKGEGTVTANLNKIKASKQEIDLYLKNHTDSLEKYLKFCKDRGVSDSYKSVLQKSHERSKGNGGPKGLLWNELSDLENVLIFVCENFGIEDVNPTENDLKIPFSKTFLETLHINPRLKNIIEVAFDDLDKSEKLLMSA